MGSKLSDLDKDFLNSLGKDRDETKPDFYESSITKENIDEVMEMDLLKRKSFNSETNPNEEETMSKNRCKNDSELFYDAAINMETNHDQTDSFHDTFPFDTTQDEERIICPKDIILKKIPSSNSENNPSNEEIMRSQQGLELSSAEPLDDKMASHNAASNALNSPKQENQTKDPWKIFDGGFVKLLTGDWGRRSTSFRSMSFFVSVMGLILYSIDIGTDIYAACDYMVGEMTDTHKGLFMMFHERQFIRYSGYRKRKDMGYFTPNFFYSNEDVLDEANTCMLLVERLGNCTVLEANNTQRPINVYLTTKITKNISEDGQITFDSFKKRFVKDNVMKKAIFKSLRTDHNLSFVLRESTKNLQHCSVMKYELTCSWKKRLWTSVIFVVMFIPGLLGLLKLLKEERRYSVSVARWKKMLLLFGFPFLGLYCKFARLKYHDSEQFALIDFSITSCEVLAESSLQFLLQHYIFLSEYRPSRYKEVFIPFLSICASGTSIFLFYLRIAIKVIPACSSCKQGKGKTALHRLICPLRRFFISFMTSGVGLPYFILVFCLAHLNLNLMSNNNSESVRFLKYSVFCVTIMLIIGLLRTCSLMEWMDDLGLVRSWHVVYHPLLLGLDSSEFINASSRYFGLVGFEWTLWLCGMVLHNCMSYYIFGELILPFFAWSSRYVEDVRQKNVYLKA